VNRHILQQHRYRYVQIAIVYFPSIILKNGSVLGGKGVVIQCNGTIDFSPITVDVNEDILGIT
jgi:hypothetical protein